jgi:hypothetical protein
VKLPQDKVENTLDHMDIGNNFMNRALIAHQQVFSEGGLTNGTAQN